MGRAARGPSLRSRGPARLLERQDHAGACIVTVPIEDRSETRYRTLFERAPIGIVYADAESVYLDANEAACRMFGYRRDEFIGLRATDIVVQDEAPEIDSALAAIRDDGEHQRQWMFRRKDGSTFAAEVIATKFPDGTLLGMIRDVSQVAAKTAEVRRLNRLLSALSRVNRAVAAASSREDLFDRICRILVEDGGLRMAWVGWLDSVTREVRPVASAGDDSGYLASIRVTADDGPDGQGPTGTAMRTGMPYIAPDLLADARAGRWHDELQQRGYLSSAAFPLRIADRVVGAMSVYADHRDAFRSKEVGLLIEIASNLSSALENMARDEAHLAAERTLATEQRFSDTIIESMPGVLYLYDTAGRFLRWNRNFEVISGYTGDEIARMRPIDFFPAEEREEVTRRISEVFVTGESSVEATFVARDGTRTPYFFTGRKVEFAGRICLVGVGIDIAERAQAQQRLEESEAHLLAAQRIAHVGSWEFDLVDGSVRWSDQVFEILGLSRATSAPSVGAFLATVHPDDRERVERALDLAVRGEAVFDLEHRSLMPDGSERVLHGQGDLRRDASGHPRSLAGTLHDITDRVRMAAEREQRHRAEAADRIKSAFLATMSHELRTPLNSIIGFTGILAQGLAGPLTDEQRKQLDMVRGSARHLLALVNDVLDISKIEAGQLEVAREPFDVAAVVRRVVETMGPLARARSLALHAEVCPDLGVLDGDGRRFEQIVINLLSNAIKFTDHGEVRVIADALSPEAADRPGGAVRLRVSDTGIGIREADLAQLFQPFRQVDGGLARTHEGTGLGLAICRRLAQLMGGDITVESVWGTGSTFTMTLPRQQED